MYIENFTLNARRDDMIPCIIQERSEQRTTTVTTGFLVSGVCVSVSVSVHMRPNVCGAGRPYGRCDASAHHSGASAAVNRVERVQAARLRTELLNGVPTKKAGFAKSLRMRTQKMHAQR